MRMRELEAETGVGRETIRYYIREGLLPEPRRTSRNSASYSEAHVARLKAIKKLQERYLPLAIIKTLLDAEDGERWLEPQTFPDLDAMLRARLDVEGGGPVPIAEVAAQYGTEIEDLRGAARAGILRIGEDDTLGPRDIAIVGVLRDLREIGFTRERGFNESDMRFYGEFTEWLVGQEMRLFFDHMTGEVSEERALAMAERGIASINELLGLMRTREILRQLQARRTGEDQG